MNLTSFYSILFYFPPSSTVLLTNSNSDLC